VTPAGVAQPSPNERTNERTTNDERTNERMNERINERINERTNERTNDERTNERTNKRMNNRQTDKPTNRPTDRPTDRRTDGRTDGRTVRGATLPSCVGEVCASLEARASAHACVHASNTWKRVLSRLLAHTVDTCMHFSRPSHRGRVTRVARDKFHSGGFPSPRFHDRRRSRGRALESERNAATITKGTVPLSSFSFNLSLLRASNDAHCDRPGTA